MFYKNLITFSKAVLWGPDGYLQCVYYCGLRLEHNFSQEQVSHYNPTQLTATINQWVILGKAPQTTKGMSKYNTLIKIKIVI